MIWVTWRQHRIQALSCLALLVALTAAVLGATIWLLHRRAA